MEAVVSSGTRSLMDPSSESLHYKLWTELQSVHEHRAQPSQATSVYVFQPTLEKEVPSLQHIPESKVEVPNAEYVEHTTLPLDQARRVFLHTRTLGEPAFHGFSREGDRAHESFLQRLDRLRSEVPETVRALECLRENTRFMPQSANPVEPLSESTTCIAARNVYELNKYAQRSLQTLRQWIDAQNMCQASQGKSLLRIMENGTTEHPEISSYVSVDDLFNTLLCLSPHLLCASAPSVPLSRLEVLNSAALQQGIKDALVHYIQVLEARYDGVVQKGVANAGLEQDLRTGASGLLVLAREISGDSADATNSFYIEHELRMLFHHLKLLEQAEIDAASAPASEELFSSLSDIKHFAHLVEHWDPAKRLKVLIEASLTPDHRRTLIELSKGATALLKGNAEEHKQAADTLQRLSLVEAQAAGAQKIIESAKESLSELQTALHAHGSILHKIHQRIRSHESQLGGN